MYATCIHCKHPLGRNDAIEALPIGHRVAFDAKLGRLWVVCRDCERWNLAPFDERWEAIEQGERAFRDTSVRVSTDNIGLARLRDGTELVRIGSPLRPEFAAWRYGDQFGRRRRRNVLTVVGAAAGLGTAVAVGTSVIIGAGLVAVLPIVQLLLVTGAVSNVGLGSRTVTLGDGSRVQMVGMPRLVAMDVEERWGLDFGVLSHETTMVSTKYRKAWFEGSQIPLDQVLRRQLRGRDALSLLRTVLPVVNRGGATPSVIADGVRLIEDAGGPRDFAQWAVDHRHEWAAKQTYGDSGDLQYIPVAARLAFEMALHEDSERRAMDGELAELTRAWRDAESVAQISDGLLIPPAIEQRVDDMKRSQTDRKDSGV